MIDITYDNLDRKIKKCKKLEVAFYMWICVTLLKSAQQKTEDLSEESTPHL
jgi:hypothetical protein